MIRVLWVSISKRNALILTGLHCLSIFSPPFVYWYPMHRAWGIDMWYMFVVLESAVIFYGCDLISGEPLTKYIFN